MNLIPISLLLFPLLGIAGILAGLPAKRTALSAALAGLAASVLALLVFPYGEGGFQFVTDHVWLDLPHFFTIRFLLGIDGINLGLVLLTAVVSASAIGMAPEGVRRPREFFICLLLVSWGAMGAFLSLDLFFFYVFHEVALIPTFILIGVWGGDDRKFAAMQITLYLAAGSLVLLAGIFAFYFALPPELRTLDMRQLQVIFRGGEFTGAAQAQIYPLLLIGFGSLVSLWPLHSWAPRGYAAAPAPAAMLHAGVLKKFGLYGLLRLAVPFLPAGMAQYANLLLFLLLANVLYIGLVTISQRRLDMMLGYSSVMHMGYLFLGLLSANIYGLTGVVVLMVAHGLSAALLFGLASEIKERTGTMKMEEMGGLASKAPVLAALFMIGTFASIGVPGLGNFAGEVLIFFGGWGAGYTIATALIIWGVVISAVYGLRSVRNILFGELPEKLSGVSDLQGWKARWPYVLLVFCLLVVGIFPRLLTEAAKPVLEMMFQ